MLKNWEGEMKNKTVVQIERTKRGFPALWEEGGGYTHTGRGVIVAGPFGEPLKPFYIRRKGHLANAHHALLPLKLGYYVVRAYHYREDFTIEVYRVVDINLNEDTATLELVAQFDEEAWDREPPAYLTAAIEAAREKAVCYHCRKPYFVRKE